MEKVKLGTILNVRGLRGEVKILSTSDFGKERYKIGNEILICTGNSDTFLTVSKYCKSGKFDYVMFNEITSVEEANKYRNCDVYFDKSKLHKLEKGSYYHHELIGLDVYDCSENYLGTVIDLDSNTVQDLLRIKNDDKEFLVPFIKTFIIDVDLTNKKIFINNMEGLL